MYLLPDMIDLGLEVGEVFPTEAHRIVAQNLFIGNSDINTRDELADGVSRVLKIPNDRIETITPQELTEFGFGLKVCL